MISVEKSYPGLAQRCYELADGESVYFPPAEVPFDMHCYGDGWYAYWKAPPSGQIGRFFATREQLSAFLNGKWTVGKAIRTRPGLQKYLAEEVGPEQPER